MATQVCGCPVTQWGGSGVTLSLDVWCADALTAITFRCDLLEQAVKRFILAGIVISPLPTTLLLRDDRQADLLFKRGSPPTVGLYPMVESLPRP